jgi:hypothetical protein
MLIEIVRHTPGWVWVLLVVLLALGWSQSKDRAVAVPRLVILPLVMFALGLSTLWPAMHKLPAVGLVWITTLALAAAASARWLVPQQARWDSAAHRLQMPGSWLPMLLILATFAVKYCFGVLQGLMPALAAGSGFLVVMCAVSGLVSGLWLGRGFALLALARSGQRADTIAPHGLAASR